MIDEFTVELRAQREWNWLVIVAFFLGGISGGLFLISTYVNFLPGLYAAIAIVALGTCTALYFDLGRPEKVLRLFTQIGSSWISRGTSLITIFIVFGTLYVLPSFVWFAWLPWSSNTELGQALQVVALIAAFGVMAYTGFVMSYSPSIPFWNTTLLPIIFIFYALMGGTAAVFSMVWTTSEVTRITEVLRPVEILLIAATFVLLFSYLATMFYATIAAKESVRMLVAGRLAWPFWGGVIVVGLLIPLAAVSFVSLSAISISVAAGLLAMAGLFELLGGLAFRYCLMKAGVYVPVM